AVPPRASGATGLWNDALLEQLASEFQPQLLMYRLEHLGEVVRSDWDVPAFVSPVREIVSTLGRSLCSAQLREDLIGIMRAQDEETRAVWSADLRAIVIEACLLACHEKSKEKVYVGEINEIAQAILDTRGEQLSVSDKGTGCILRSVGLSTERLDSAGRGIRLSQKARECIHALSQSYGVRSISQPFEGCVQCKAVVAPTVR
ncbi:MAG TPA: hypothetical protein VLC12_03825, partial [Terriglobales bacterium]|nr:hypothetical protein [Terriglobales bacterium]